MGDERKEMPFTAAVVVKLATSLSRGLKYLFVGMGALDRGSRWAYVCERCTFVAGGSRFMAADTLMARITPCLENGKLERYCEANRDRYYLAFPVPPLPE